MFLIIGANGSIGSQVVKQLVSAKEKVRVLVRDPKKAASLTGVDVVVGDLLDRASLDAAFAGVKAAFVLSAGESIVKGEQNAFAAAKSAGVGHIVLLSVVGAQKGSPVHLADWHGQSEDNLKASGVPFTILQPTSFMQNLLGSASSVKSEGKLYGAQKSGRVPLIDLADIAATAAAILRAPTAHAGKSIYLTGPEALAQAQVAEKIGKAIGKGVAYVDVPPSAVVDGAKKAGMPAWLAEDFGALNAFFATDAGAFVSDAVEQITGRKARAIDAWLTDNARAFT